MKVLTKSKNNHAGFWRRLAALWIDVFVIVLLSLFEVRISFETLFIILGALYSVVMLLLQRQTTGKMLMRITVTSNAEEPVYFRNIIIREVLGKWVMTVSMPVMLGMILIGNSWLPTISGILVMILAILLCFIYFIVRKQEWYDDLSGLTVTRISSVQKNKPGFYFLIAASAIGIGTGFVEFSVKGRLPCRMPLLIGQL